MWCSARCLDAGVCLQWWIFFEMRIVSLLGSNKCSGTCRSSGGLWSSSSGACSRSLGDCSQGFHPKRDSRGNQVVNSSEAWLCRKGIGDRQIDVVLSDMAPSNPGLASVNHDMTLRLVYSVLEVIPTYIFYSLSGVGFSSSSLYVQLRLGRTSLSRYLQGPGLTRWFRISKGGQIIVYQNCDISIRVQYHHQVLHHGEESETREQQERFCWIVFARSKSQAKKNVMKYCEIANFLHWWGFFHFQKCQFSSQVSFLEK